MTSIGSKIPPATVPLGPPHVIDLSFNGTRSTEAVDFDKDGDIDVVAAGEFEDEFAWFENPGPDMVIGASSWTRNVINPATLDGAGAVCACDLDEDGDLDVGAVADGSGRQSGTSALVRKLR